MKNKLLEKSGNNFIIGILIVFAGIGIGTIFLTYKDYKSSSVNVSSFEQYSMVIETSTILEEMNQEEKEFQELLLAHAGKDTTANSISSNAFYKTTISFGELGSATILEEYSDDEETIYFCSISLKDYDMQTIRITMHQDNTMDMVVINENGEQSNDTINIPLSISEYLVSVVQKNYSMRNELN